MQVGPQYDLNPKRTILANRKGSKGSKNNYPTSIV
jgi:hypothetical protein